MKALPLTIFCLGLCALAGCGGKDAPDTAANSLDSAFGLKAATNTAVAPEPPPVVTPASAPAVREQVAAVRQEIKSGELLNAALRVRQLQAATNLNGEQMQALHETSVEIQQRLLERANAGDPAAKRQWDEYQKSLTR